MVTEAFQRWALGFSGCDGGNPRGGIWICGIEWGGGHTDENLKLADDVSRPGSVGDPTWNQEDLDQFLKYQYNWKVAKLLCAIVGRPVTTYREFFQRERCFRGDSHYFKMNLYPLGFHDTSPTHWQPWLTERTGFENKSEYKKWCREKRFPILRSWELKYIPELIVCTGKGHRTEFLETFGDGSEPAEHITTAGKDISYIWTNGGRTLVAVIYFLGGPGGLKGDEEITATGKSLAALRTQGPLHHAA